MVTDKPSPGKTTITPEVLLTIARMGALEVEGVRRMAPIKGGVRSLVGAYGSDGVRIKIEDENVFVDLYLVLESGVNIREVSRNVQRRVARAIYEMIGVEVGLIDIHIEDIDFSSKEA